ncbi:sigma-54-dependent Fis family transcriptional regulator, partial [bacterium]|nr:sigma-54-dependent Fis family transcriptional regulator [bacterium]
MSSLPAILVIDDEVRSQEALRRTLEDDFTVFTAGSAEEAEGVMGREFIHIVLCDQRMPGTTGVQFLKQVRERWPDTVRLILSGYTDAEDIIAGVNEAGIWQYLLKPWQPDQLLLTLKSAASLWTLQQENQRLALDLLKTSEPTLRRRVEQKSEKARQRFGVDGDQGLIRAADSPLNAVCELVARIAPHDLSVLLTGESGTGKEKLARALHYQSRRGDKAFVVENCGALPDQLLEAELFGYKRGAFTGAFEDRIGLFQQANGGTIFLDEIGETSPAFQVKLLRVLQEGEFRPLGGPRPVSVDVRVVAATNRDLDADVLAGRFREDLYYRLATVPIHVPPLRERPSDIMLLAQALLESSARSLGKPQPVFSAEALVALTRYRWPGNVRELQNEILRMVALCDGRSIDMGLLSSRVLGPPPTAADMVQLAQLNSGDGSLKERMDRLEAQVVRETMIRHQWNKSRAARELGLSRVGLRAKLVRYGLEKAGE